MLLIAAPASIQGKTEPPRAGYRRANCGIWLGRKWVRSRPSAGAIRQLGQLLARRGIRYAFPLVGSFRASGGLWRGSSHARNTLVRLRKSCPGLKIIPWVYGFLNKHAFPERTRWRSRAARDIIHLVGKLGADGIHMDVEPKFGSFGQIPGRAMARLLQILRRKAGRLFISLALHPLKSPSFSRGLEPASAQMLVAFADQITVMAYDTAISRARRFRHMVTEQIGLWQKLAFLEKSRCRFLMGTATYDRHSNRRFRQLHDPRVENIRNTALGVAAGISLLSRPHSWDGLALFAGYTTDIKEWRTFKEYWQMRE